MNKEYENKELPSDLQNKVTKELVKNNLINKKPPYRLYYSLLILLCVLAFAGGFLVKNFSGENKKTAAVQPAKNKYMLILQNPENFITEGNHATEYGSWMHSLIENGFIAEGNELEDEGMQLIKNQQGIIAQTPEGKTNTVSGYFIISADNESKVMEIVRSCPHLKYNGRVILKKII